MVPIYENYKDYQAPHYAEATITKLLSTLPNHYLSGLQSIVLTNSMAIGKGKTNRIKGKKFHRQHCFGILPAKMEWRAAVDRDRQWFCYGSDSASFALI